MLASAAIASVDFEALKAVVNGKDNEVFDTTLFDSYDDKRIEELLLLEAANLYSDFVETNIKNKIPKLQIIDKTTEYEFIPESNKEYNKYEEPNDNPSRYYTTEKDCDYFRFRQRLRSILNEIRDKQKMYIDTHITVPPYVSASINFYNDKFHDQVNKQLSTEISYNVIEFKIISERTVKQTRSGCSYHHGTFIIVFNEEKKYVTQKICLDISFLPVKKAREYLLKRICERHALNETIVQSMKKKLEVERLYYKLKDLYDEDTTLTKSVNAKREQLNSLKEDICSKKVELEKLDMRILQNQNELEAQTLQMKQLQLASSTTAELDNLNLQLKQLRESTNRYEELVSAKQAHDYYLHFNNDLKVYRFSFEHMREIALKLEQEKAEFEKRKSEETKTLKDDIESREKQFDKDCEQYEIELTKWKSQQESKFQKYKKQIDNYDKLESKISKQQSEITRLKNQINQITKERDRLKITIETLTEYKK